MKSNGFKGFCFAFYVYEYLSFIVTEAFSARHWRWGNFRENQNCETTPLLSWVTTSSRSMIPPKHAKNAYTMLPYRHDLSLSNGVHHLRCLTCVLMGCHKISYSIFKAWSLQTCTFISFEYHYWHINMGLHINGNSLKETAIYLLPSTKYQSIHESNWLAVLGFSNISRLLLSK